MAFTLQEAKNKKLYSIQKMVVLLCKQNTATPLAFSHKLNFEATSYLAAETRSVINQHGAEWLYACGLIATRC